MRTVLISCLVASLTTSRVDAAVKANESDFVVVCGTDMAGHVNVTYTNSDPVFNKVAKMSSPNNRDTCKAVPDENGKISISDVRANCILTRSERNVTEFWLQLTLQEFDGVYQNSDPTFLFRCSYPIENLPVSTNISDGGTIGTPNIVHLDLTGKPDRGYFLKILNTTTRSTVTGAKFGQQVLLQVSMDGTDEDEQGVQVESCIVTSGSVSLPFIEKSCVVPDKRRLFKLPGFISAGKEAFFPITLFALEESRARNLMFQCVIRICSSNCDGLNCPPSAGRRKRRASGGQPSEEKTVTMATNIEILPNDVFSSGSDSTPTGKTNRPDSDSVESIENLGFIVTVAVFAVLLLIATVIIIFLLTSKWRELQKQGG